MSQKIRYDLYGEELGICQRLTRYHFHVRPALLWHARIALFVLFVAQLPLGRPESVGEEKGNCLPSSSQSSRF